MQIAVYKRILDLEAVANLVHKDKACDCGSKKAYVILPLLRPHYANTYHRRKKCCHPVHPGDLFKYMSTLIKIANHLALILPGQSLRLIRGTVANYLLQIAPTDTIDQVRRPSKLCA